MSRHTAVVMVRCDHCGAQVDEDTAHQRWYHLDAPRPNVTFTIGNYQPPAWDFCSDACIHGWATRRAGVLPFALPPDESK